MQAVRTPPFSHPITRSPQLAGLRCLRCATPYPLTLAHDGCLSCRDQGFHVSLRADYTGHAQDGVHRPYRQSVSLGEGRTPLLTVDGLAQRAGVAELRFKDESRNPTGSHKDRMAAVGVTQALDMAAHTVVLASSGNAAIAAAHYAQAAGLACEVAVYGSLARPFAAELDRLHARVVVCCDNEARWRHVRDRAAQPGVLALTNHHLPALGSAPLAVEAYKAIAAECWHDGYLPTDVLVPTARGDLAWGVHAGFGELRAAGRIARRPRVWVVEPFPRLSQVLAGAALHGLHGGTTQQFSTAGNTVTYLQWLAAQESQGGAIVVDDAHAVAARAALQLHGISAELCAAAAYAGVDVLRERGELGANARVLLLLTASAARDPTLTVT
jgi:threonine synthase